MHEDHRLPKKEIKLGLNDNWKEGLDQSNSYSVSLMARTISDRHDSKDMKNSRIKNEPPILAGV